MDKNNKRKIIGSALVDYVIPTALVGIVVGLGMFSIYKSGVLTKFFAASSGIELNGGTASLGESKDSSGMISSSGSSSGSGSSSSTTSGTTSCDDSVCTIDFGTYTLDGIPEDFSDYIESSSSSGGTGLLADLLEQIAEEADLPEEEKNLIKTLANYGHDIASAEKGIETYYTSNDITSGFIPEEAKQYFDQITPSEYYPDRPISKFAETLDTVISQLDLSSSPDASSTKEMVSVLAAEIQAMAFDVEALSEPLDAGPMFSDAQAQESVDLILDPDTSERTDINSALICASGKGEDLGLSCN